MSFGRLPWYFGLIFGGAGFLIFAIGCAMASLQHYRLATYVPVQATVLSADVKTHSSSDGATHEPVIHYRYQVDGKSYESNRVGTIGGVSQSGGWAYSMMHQFATGRKVTAWVSLRDPSQAFLSRAPEYLPHWLALFSLPFLSIGLCALYASKAGRRWPAPPTLHSDGWMALRESGSVRARLLTWVFATTVFSSIITLAVWDLWWINGRKFDTFSNWVASIAAVLASVGFFFVLRFLRLWLAFGESSVSVRKEIYRVGETMELRVRQQLKRGMVVDEMNVAAVCMISERISHSNSVSYPPEREVQHCAQTLMCDKTYASGTTIETTARIELPADASPSSPRGRGDYPIYQWFVLLEISSEGPAKYSAWFPIVIAEKTPSHQPGMMLTT